MNIKSIKIIFGRRKDMPYSLFRQISEGSVKKLFCLSDESREFKSFRSRAIKFDENQSEYRLDFLLLLGQAKRRSKSL